MAFDAWRPPPFAGRARQPLRPVRLHLRQADRFPLGEHVIYGLPRDLRIDHRTDEVVPFSGHQIPAKHRGLRVEQCLALKRHPTTLSAIRRPAAPAATHAAATATSPSTHSAPSSSTRWPSTTTIATTALSSGRRNEGRPSHREK